MKQKVRRRVYDESWKYMLEKYLWEFMEFYFPERFSYIDPSQGYRFLDQELDKIAPRSESKKRRVDKLIEVHLKSQESLWVLVHIEVQTYKDAKFAERMFTYHYRIFDKFKVPVASLAILGDPSPRFRPQGYVLEALGKRFVAFEFEICKLLDWQGKEEELKKHENIFGLVTLAHLKSWESNYTHRFRWKLELTKLLYERGYSKEVVLSLHRFIDGVIALPEGLEIEYRDELAKIEEEKIMPYITSIERMAEKRGREQGIQEGIQKGIQKGREQGIQEGREQECRVAIQDVLEVKFGKVAKEIHEKIKSIEEYRVLKKLLKKAAVVSDIDSFTEILDSYSEHEKK